jgi:thioredoxin-like negative regulator of GroEL
MINRYPMILEEVKQLVEEGFDSFSVVTALAFAELDIDNARAILIADQMDEEGGRRRSTQQQQLEQQQQAKNANAEPVRQEMKTVKVDSNSIQPKGTHLPRITERSPTATVQASQASEKSDVVFEATAATVQELVLSHQYRYFDIYAPWCKPCLVLCARRNGHQTRWCLSSRQD